MGFAGDPSAKRSDDQVIETIVIDIADPSRSASIVIGSNAIDRKPICAVETRKTYLSVEGTIASKIESS